MVSSCRIYEALQDTVYIWRPPQVHFGMPLKSIKTTQIGYVWTHLDSWNQDLTKNQRGVHSKYQIRPLQIRPNTDTSIWGKSVILYVREALDPWVFWDFWTVLPPDPGNKTKIPKVGQKWGKKWGKVFPPWLRGASPMGLLRLLDGVTTLTQEIPPKSPKVGQKWGKKWGKSGVKSGAKVAQSFFSIIQRS